MTENEAIEGFKIDNSLLGDNEKGTVERNNLAINALEEIQQYRAIGTVSDVEFYKKCYEEESYEYCGEYGTDTCGCQGRLQYIEKQLSEYQLIGTVERFRQLSEQFKPHTVDESCCLWRSCNQCDNHRKEAEAYRSIGTVEECRVAVERMKQTTFTVVHAVDFSSGTAKIGKCYVIDKEEEHREA